MNLYVYSTEPAVGYDPSDEDRRKYDILLNAKDPLKERLEHMADLYANGLLVSLFAFATKAKKVGILLTVASLAVLVLAFGFDIWVYSIGGIEFGWFVLWGALKGLLFGWLARGLFAWRLGSIGGVGVVFRHGFRVTEVKPCDWWFDKKGFPKRGE